MKPDVYSTEGNLSLSLPSPLDKRGTVYRLCMDWLLLFILCASSYLPFIGIFQLPVGTFLPLLIFACLFLSLLFSGLFFFHKIAIWFRMLVYSGVEYTGNFCAGIHPLC